MKKPLPENRNEALDVLRSAEEAIVNGTKHGDPFNSFQMIGELWTVYLTHIGNARVDPTILPHDVAEMMSMVKVARTVYGEDEDNYVDQLGYTALAAMLRGK
jgi:hypothetical protein